MKEKENTDNHRPGCCYPDIHTPGYRVQHSELGSTASGETDTAGYRAGK